MKSSGIFLNEIFCKSVVVRNKEQPKIQHLLCNNIEPQPNKLNCVLNNLRDFLSRTMEWTEIHDTLLCREVLLEEPYKYKKGSNEKGKKWTEIAEALNKSEEVKFKVSQRGVRERMERLQKKHLEKKKEEVSGSGMAVDDVTGLDT